MTPARLARGDVWFAVRWRRLWAVRREGHLAIAKFYALIVLMAAVGSLLAAFINPYCGIGTFAIGFGLSFLWFGSVQRRHTDYSISYDDYFREKSNA